MTINSSASKFIYLPLYLSDYVSEARKLTMLERGAFIDLAVLYFQENLQLFHSKSKIFRMVFAFEKEEQDAVEFVLKKFFRETEKEPMGLCWVSDSLDKIGAQVLRRLDANRNNGKRGGRGKRKEEKPMGSDSLNPNSNPNESILNQTKLNQTNLNQELKEKQFPEDAQSMLEASLEHAKSNPQACHTDTGTETRLPTKPSKPIDPIYQQLTDGLKFVLEAKLNKSIRTTGWNDQMRLLVETDLKTRTDPVSDVMRAIQEVSNRFGEKYFPVIQSASSLREKFSKIEAAIERNRGSQESSTRSTYNNLLNKYQNE